MVKNNDIPANSPGYETRDANVRGVYNFLIFMAVVLVAVGLVSWGLFRFFAAQDRAEDKDGRNVSPFAETRQVPMGPQLQVTPREDWLKYRAEEEHNLENLSWGNRATGIVNVPIEQAMDILVKKGLPVQGATPPADAAKPVAPAAPAVQGTKKP